MSTGPQDSSMDQLGLQRRGELVSYQIFPDPEEEQQDQDQDQDPAQVRNSVARLKERLPSIVVEPSEESEEEVQQWFPRSQSSIEEQEPEEELELFQDQCEPSGGGQDENRDVDGVPHFKRSSIPGIEIDYNRLTPPPLLTSSHAAPPCLRS
ncbi:protein LBH-like [Danio aesculapii]|uniref:protein LBH-like n=1 Tax=Danio aesculapii TaxID=1142201 RepID=UPI0024C0E3F5|nr:protein LBH-like [Danio aesculapii]